MIAVIPTTTKLDRTAANGDKPCVVNFSKIQQHDQINNWFMKKRPVPRNDATSRTKAHINAFLNIFAVPVAMTAPIIPYFGIRIMFVAILYIENI